MSDLQRQHVIEQALAAADSAMEQHGWPRHARGEARERFAVWLSDELHTAEWLAIIPLLVEVFAATADAPMALRNWDRYLHASFNLQSLLRLVTGNREHLAYLAKLFAFSQFFSDIVVRNPEYLEWVLAEAVLDREKSLDEYRTQLENFVRPFKSEDSRRRALCRFKRCELLRIGARGLLNRGDMAEQCRELSSIAEAATGLAFDDCWPVLLARHGMPSPPQGKHERESPGFAVVAMGKFGGEELNFSSDVDFVFVYDSEGTTAGKTDQTGHVSGRISNHEFYCKLANAITQYLSYPTTEGVLYRVDTRLRPEGSSGAVARSLSGYTLYFNQQARAWEKIPYIKARVVAGDRLLESPFLARCHSFIYGQNDPGILLPEIARLKKRIDFERLDTRGRQLDIKRGPGGIREIEFIINALQLLHGVYDKSLRVRATLDALGILEEKGEFPSEDAVILRDAYWFYRLVEHTLQMMEEQQTHALPENPAHRTALAKRCGFHSAEQFEQLLADYRAFVRARFEDLFHESIGRALTLSDKLARNEPPDEAALAELAPYQLGTVEGFNALRELAVGSSEVALTVTGQRRFEELLPRLLGELDRTAMPALAVRHLANLMAAHRGVSMLYDMMLAHPPVLRLLARVLGFGLLPARSLIAHPELLDEMIEGEALAQHRSPNEMFEQQIAPHIGGDSESALKRLRHFHESESVYLAVRELMGIVTPREAADQTTELAETSLRAVARIAADDDPETAPWCVLALGSFGGSEVTLTADLDVAFFYDPDVVRDGNVMQRMERAASNIISAMTAITPEGTLWKMDARLRPDGRNAPLTVSLERARRYYTDEANIWEFQSVTRARFVAGNPRVGERVIDILREAFRARSPFPNLREEIQSMRRRLEEVLKLPRHASFDLKRSPGGLIDIEFLVQYIQLSHGLEHPDLLQPTMHEALDAIGRAGLLDSESLAFVSRHYTNLRAVQRVVRLLWETPRDYIPEQKEKREQLERALAGNHGDEISLAKVSEDMMRMRAVFDTVLTGE